MLFKAEEAVLKFHLTTS